MPSVLKTDTPERVSGVRIPPFPLGGIVYRLEHEPFKFVGRVRFPLSLPKCHHSSTGRAPVLYSGGWEFNSALVAPKYRDPLARFLRTRGLAVSGRKGGLRAAFSFAY
jgi:hypothetical protein